MNEVVKKYRSLITANDTILTRAILAMFEYVKETDNFQVGICYNHQNLIQEQTVLINSIPVKVISAGTAFTSEKNKKREDVITDLIRKAFRMITPEDILSFNIVQTTMTKEITFLIKYVIQNSGLFYYHTSEEHVAEDKRTWYTGVEFNWKIEIIIPKYADKFSLEFKSKPAPHFTSKGGETDKVYDAMADSAFADFSQMFIKQSGFMPIIAALESGISK